MYGVPQLNYQAMLYHTNLKRHCPPTAVYSYVSLSYCHRIAKIPILISNRDTHADAQDYGSRATMSQKFTSVGKLIANHGKCELE